MQAFNVVGQQHRAACRHRDGARTLKEEAEKQEEQEEVEAGETQQHTHRLGVHQ
jgi:hypothetical protein